MTSFSSPPFQQYVLRFTNCSSNAIDGLAWVRIRELSGVEALKKLGPSEVPAYDTDCVMQVSGGSPQADDASRSKAARNANHHLESMAMSLRMLIRSLMISPDAEGWSPSPP